MRQTSSIDIEMKLSDFDFNLPENRIALRPASPKESARLLHVDELGAFHDFHIYDLPKLIAPGSVVVVNDTKVIPTQLFGFRQRTESRIPIKSTLIKSLDADHWEAFIKPGRRVHLNDQLVFHNKDGETLTAKAIDKFADGRFVLRFEKAGLELIQALHSIGAVPIPPYISAKRDIDEQDITDYQTIFAQSEGSVAAPTAGLHFTEFLINQLKAKQVTFETVTLHIGAGTFLPVKTENIADHTIHSEFGIVSHEVANRLNLVRSSGRKIVCVGTTSLRVLETCCNIDNIYAPYADYTDIFITPGTTVSCCDQLLTKFHLPKSTLFMLACAFSGQSTIQAAYQHAINSDYRFFSYGDACLLANRSHS